MNIFEKCVKSVIDFFTSGKAEKALMKAAEMAPHVLPLIDLATTVCVTLTPNGIDDDRWASIKKKFPKLFEPGSDLTTQEIKLYALAIATELMQWKFPGLSTSIARTSVQLAYTGKTAE